MARKMKQNYCKRRKNNSAQTRKTFPCRFTSYSGIDDFVKKFPFAAVNKYGERVIRGVRIC